VRWRAGIIEAHRAAVSCVRKDGRDFSHPSGPVPGLHRAERTIADRLTGLANGRLPWPWIDPDKALPWVEKHISLAFESQVAAVRLAQTSKITVMTEGW